MKKVRFAPSPTGSLHIGNALSAYANRRLGDWMLLRIDDTDPVRNVPGGEEAIVHDLEWLGIAWDEGPVRQSERQDRYRDAAVDLGDRFEGVTLLREECAATTIVPTRSCTGVCTRRSGRARRSTCTTVSSSVPTERSCRNAPRARPSSRCATRASRPKRSGATSSSSTSRSTTSTTTWRASAATPSRRSQR